MRIEALKPADLEKHPVWQYSLGESERPDETFVRPVVRLPVKSLSGRVVGLPVRLANETERWAIIGNVHSRNAMLNQHFITLSIFNDGKWFTLSRYHDIDARTNGPEALARFLRLSLDEVFPITYDLRKYVRGSEDALRGVISSSPAQVLTRAQIIALAVP